MMNILLKENEKIEDLQLKGLKIIQNKKWFCFGMDAVLLSDFYDLKKKSSVVDIGTGTGIIPILLYGKKNIGHITGIEIQGEVAEMAQRSVEMNNLSEYIKIIDRDLKDWRNYLETGGYDAVVSNPPYIRNNSGIINSEDKKAFSRHEITCSLEDVIEAASGMLKNNGALFMVHRPERLVDIFCSMRENRIEPKKIRYVYPKKNKKPNLVLVKGVKNGGKELRHMDPLYIYYEDKEYTDEIYKIYNMRRKS